MSDTAFLTAGTPTEKSIPVRITYKIIELFSEGLYSSPTKAIEELVSNAFDAGAHHVHVLLSPDLADPAATIVVIDDGIGMDRSGLEQHWLIGISNKRDATYVAPKGRKQIGRFGIGKLATYVLAKRLTHISKRNGHFLATTMDYSRVAPAASGTDGAIGSAVDAASPTGKKAKTGVGSEGGELISKESVHHLTVRSLSENQTKAALKQFVEGNEPGHKALQLFGAKAASSWTVAILSQLQTMAAQISLARLRWVLQTAMPLRDDFRLFLNGEELKSAKATKLNRVGRWVLGKDVVTLPPPVKEVAEVSEDKSEDLKSQKRFGLVYPGLGRVSGYIEAFTEPIDTGKSAELERSHGFFVYVHGRLINVEDPGFEINRDKLRHGTFARFRMVLHADGLDTELRSSREKVRAGPKFNLAQAIANAGFNFARSKMDEKSGEEKTGSRVARRVSQSPAGLTRRPISKLLTAAFDRGYEPRHFVLPTRVGADERAALLAAFSDDDDDKSPIEDAKLVSDLTQHDPIAVLDVQQRVLKININHPFVAYFLDEFENESDNLPLELLAMSEVLTEANLLQHGIEEAKLKEILGRRDDLLRHLARSSARKPARQIAQDLVDASNSQDGLEEQLVAAFNSIGFEAIPKGGPGVADGVADAKLPAKADGTRRAYRVSLEAKSKKDLEGTVSAKDVNVSAIARHRDDLKAQHAIVVGPDFPTTAADKSALAKEMEADWKGTEQSEGGRRTITLVRVKDLARLVVLVPLHRVNLERIREFLTTCRTPEQSEAWITAVQNETRQKPPYKDVLEAVDALQGGDPNEQVQLQSVKTYLKMSRGIVLSSEDIGAICKSIQNIVPDWIYVTGDGAVEMYTKPAKILAAIGQFQKEK